VSSLELNAGNQVGTLSQKGQLLAVALQHETLDGIDIRKRPRVGEIIIQNILLICGVVSIVTTALIVYSLLNQAVGFFNSLAWLPARTLTVNSSVERVAIPNAIDAISTEISLVTEAGELVGALARLPYMENQLIRIENEIMLVTSVGREAITVERGAEDMTAVNHESGMPIEALVSNPIRLGEELSATDTQIGLQTVGTLPFIADQVIRLHNEDMRIIEVAAGNTSITVERGYNGTTAADYPLGESVMLSKQPTISEFLTHTKWQPQIGDFGVLPLVYATLMTTIIALLVAVPLGLGAAVYLSEYASLRARSTLKPILEILAGVPTVVYGFFAITFVTPLLRGIFGADNVSIYNMASAGLVMGVMIVPTISSISEDALSAVPRSLREASYGLGATKLETIVRVIIPGALSGIIAAFILGMSRAVGETMIVAIAAGAGPASALNFLQPFQAGETMTGHIARISGGDLSYGSIDYNSIFAIGLALFVMTLILNLISGFITRRFREVYQ
jgi:phosphate transport system permease protein